MRLPDHPALGGPLTLVEVLDAYDGPTLFVGANAAGQRYVAFWTGDATYLYVAASVARVEALRTGGMDLRDAFLDAEDGHVLHVAQTPSAVTVLRRPCASLDPDTLPPPGDRLTAR